MVINLHTTQSPVSRSERMKINENWQKIIEGLSRLQYQINLLAGGEEVEELLKRITDAINGAIEAATNANDATSNANLAADAAHQVVQTAIEKITVVEELLIKLEVQQDEWEHIKSSLILVSEAAQEATTNANSATMNANQASDAANAAKENLTNAVTTKLNEADTAITNANSAATTATQASESIKGWGTATVWNSTTSYLKNNVVTYNGSTWQAKADNTNSVPTITNVNWIILAQRGVDGKGSVASVNGKLPDETGNVDLDFGEGTVKSVNDIYPDKNGNVHIDVSQGTVQKVNGKLPNEAGEVTLLPIDLGNFTGDILNDHSVSMLKLTQEVIDAINAGGGDVGNSFFVPYPLVTNETSQKSWSLPVGAYDAATDSLLVFHNAGALAPDSWNVTGSTATGFTVNIPDNPITAIADNNVLVLILKNTPSNLPEDISGTRLTNSSVGIEKLSQEVKNSIRPVEIVTTLGSDRNDAALAASKGKELKALNDSVVQVVDNHMVERATTDKLGHIKPDGKSIIVDPMTGVASAITSRDIYQEGGRRTDKSTALGFYSTAGYYTAAARVSNVDPNTKTCTFNTVTGFSVSDTVTLLRHINNDVANGIKYLTATIKGISGTTVTFNPTDDIANINFALKPETATNYSYYGQYANGLQVISAGRYSIAHGAGTLALGTQSHAEGNNTNALGSYSHAEGEGATASGDYSHAEGNGTTASGSGSHAEGNSTLASHWYSHSEGNNTTASGVAAHAEGTQTTASGMFSHAEGGGTIASGYYSHAQGFQTTSDVHCSAANGRYNKKMSGSINGLNNADDAFVIGNGSSTTLSNAFRVTFDGKTYGVGAFNTTGADYAEYFEWLDGNPKAEDRVGFVVTLEGDKIRKATAEDTYILGIISVTPSIIGDSFQEDWQAKYVLDEWGRTQYHWVDTEYEEIVIVEDEEGNISQDFVTKTRQDYLPIINPNWDNTEEYIPREKRKEWNAVGLVGKLYVRDDGTCNANGFAKIGSDDGTVTASSSHTNMRVMERVAPNIVRMFLK
ncbi:peptidase G2 autoproteolytic cleavage domain-containing protein [Lysinibacillus xylanilyticus]|uniref:peptidase G2 autoproteolytic cleavage domain-containing protein n=1 Tax=Lysinibacillus xylanilyticus TaxID=582475 RepID=UPI003D00BFFB